MDRRKIVSVQLDKGLREKLTGFRATAEKRLGRTMTESEMVRVLLRRGLDTNVDMVASGYVEGWRHGMAEAKAALAAGLAEARAAAYPEPT